MPRVQEFKKITKHFFPSRELYIAAMERGEIKEGDEVFIEGSETLKVDNTLILNSDGILGVNTVTEAIKDNTLPITSGGVNVILGNINVLLETI